MRRIRIPFLDQPRLDFRNHLENFVRYSAPALLNRKLPCEIELRENDFQT
jgi:hypothetical protein